MPTPPAQPDRQPPDKDRKAFLDGVRGWAALMVVAYHMQQSFPVAGLEPDGSRLVHFLSDGPLAVYIFFVLSGFVLSTGFFDSGDRRVILSAALRRYPRLTIPVFASCLIAFALMKAGLMQNQPAALAAGSRDWLYDHYGFAPSLESLLRYGLWEVYWDGDSPICYNAVLWTMPLEMAGSLLVFTLLYLCGHRGARPVVYAVALALLGWLDSHLMTFVLGMVLADLYRFPPWQRLRNRPTGIAIGLAAAVAGFLLSTGTAGVITTPAAMSLVATCFVVAVTASRPLASLFETPLSGFVGRLSFPIYLVHVVLICSASAWLYLWVARLGLSPTGSAVTTQLFTFTGAMLAAMAFEPVERFAVRFSRRFAHRVLALG